MFDVVLSAVEVLHAVRKVNHSVRVRVSRSLRRTDARTKSKFNVE